MNRNYFLIIAFAALASLFLIFFSLWREIETPGVKEPVILPPVAPYKFSISGVGVAEASSENVSISSPLNRLVDKVWVKVGEKVKKGDILFTLENSDLKAELAAQEEAYRIGMTRLHRLQAYPRSEDLEIAIAGEKGAQAELELARHQYEMILGLLDPRAVSQEERNRRFYQYQQAEAKWRQAQADANKVRAGTWAPDLEVARLQAQQALANANRVKAEIQRTIVQSPIDGTVLQVKVHEGEFSSAEPFKIPMMIIGNIDDMFLRVSIDQYDIPNFDPSARAVAFLQGDAKIKFPLEFVRAEPLLVNKENLTNELTEKVDTRVLQIIYRILEKDHHIYVGQQMDVFIESENPV
jgi:multidrug efflux pump subunit AcrA (membrane-fusion protein)